MTVLPFYQSSTMSFEFCAIGDVTYPITTLLLMRWFFKNNKRERKRENYVLGPAKLTFDPYIMHI